MPKYITIGYGDQAGYDRTPQSVKDAAHAQDVQLRLEGALMGVAGTPVQVRNPDATGLETHDGAFMSSALPIAGFAVIEAADLAEAVQKVSRVPCAVAHGVVEIWPLREAGEEPTSVLRKQEAPVVATAENKDELEIRRLIANWSKALEAKDVDGLTADYAPDAVLYDAIPPYKAVGVENIRKAWESCLPYLPEFKSIHRDLTVHVTGDMALVLGLHNFETETAHPCSQSWIRITVCYRRIDGQWKVVHEHVSLPFNPMDNHAWQIADPETLDMPNYGQAAQEKS